LPRSAHVPEDEVAGIAVDFIGCEGHTATLRD
jgi:hypothetical protein